MLSSKIEGCVELRTGINIPNHTGVAQLVEHWSPKPAAVGSIPTARAKM